MLARLRKPATTLGARFMSSDAVCPRVCPRLPRLGVKSYLPILTSVHSAPQRPMTRFVQYPFDKTKMAEVREWVNGSDLPAKLRGPNGVKNVEFSFCPGEGWLAARYIFDDLEDMKSFLGSSALEDAKGVIGGAPHYDSSRSPHEFKGFFLPEV